MIDRAVALINSNRTLLTNGYNNGNWLGGQPAITSSDAAISPLADGLGYGFAEEVGTVPFNFMGSPVNNGDFLIRYTLYGDGNLSGNVNSIDFNLLVAGYGMASNADWVDGDFDFNRKSNTIDFNFLAGNFGSAAPAPIFGAVAIDSEEDSVLA